jgi:hypothetical protein
MTRSILQVKSHGNRGDTGDTGNIGETRDQITEFYSKSHRLSERNRFVWIIALLAEVANENRAHAVEALSLEASIRKSRQSEEQILTRREKNIK